MSSTELQRLIAEASVLAGGQHQCAVLGHQWKSAGGRQCPYARHHANEPNCSQTVYECGSCGDADYGEPGGPGHHDCVVDGPCSYACKEARDAVSEEASHE